MSEKPAVPVGFDRRGRMWQRLAGRGRAVRLRPTRGAATLGQPLSGKSLGKKEQQKASLFFLPLFSFPHRNVTTGAATLPPAGLPAARPALTAAAATTARWASSWERREGLKNKIEGISEVLLLLSSCSPPSPPPPQLRVAGTPCRQSMDTCDLPEFCNGRDGSCPEDYYMMDGLPCHDAYCYEGRCQTYDFQCRELFAPGAPADVICK